MGVRFRVVLDQRHAWGPLAWLELAGVLNARRGASRRVLLTRLGGGGSGNEAAWITSAIDRALACVAGQNLKVLAVSR